MEVNLGGSFLVTHLEIENRPDDTCQERVGIFKVIADGNLLDQLTGQPSKLVVPVHRAIQYVRVQIDGDTFLHLGALRAIGVRDSVEPSGNSTDLALHKKVLTSSQHLNFVGKLLVDGDPQTFMHTNSEVGGATILLFSFFSCFPLC